MPANTLPVPEKSSITACILAGGLGRRMGNLDKGLQLFRNQALVAHIIERIQPQVSRLILNANQHAEAYAAWGFPVYPDQRSGFAGPLAGMESALIHCETPWLLTVPCDTPFLPVDLVTQLSHRLITEQADLAIAVTGTAADFQAHPVCCLLSTRLLPQLAGFLDQGGRKIDQWYASLRVAQTHFADTRAFANINTLEELQQLDHKTP